jgi:hypothetical protein
MKWHMHYDENEKIIFISTSGVLDIRSASILRSEGAELIKHHNCMRCLLDHRNIKRDALSTLDIYDLPKRYDELGIPRQLKMAVVVQKSLMDNLSFYETVCRNNGYSVSLFFDREFALEWLRK